MPEQGVVVGKSAPDFTCTAVMDGRLKGMLPHSHPFLSPLIHLPRDLPQHLHALCPLADPDLLPTRLVLHLPN